MKGYPWRVIVEHDLIRLMPDWPQRHDGSAGAENVVREKLHLVVGAEIFDHFGAGDFRALEVPGSILVLVAMAGMEVEISCR